MSANFRHYTLLDQVIRQIDEGIRTITGNSAVCQRPNPASDYPEVALSPAAKRLSAGLMRVDHVGEVCAQALYQGQALTSRSNEVRKAMEQAAAEEVDHLVWCQERLSELNSHTSWLNPFWYLHAWCLGVIAGVAGDRWNLGFVAETEHQVVQHLDDHLARLPVEDIKSRVILQQMRDDEAQHAMMAITNGGKELPLPVKWAMRFMSKMMTTTAYWF